MTAIYRPKFSPVVQALYDAFPDRWIDAAAPSVVAAKAHITADVTVDLHTTSRAQPHGHQDGKRPSFETRYCAQVHTGADRMRSFDGDTPAEAVQKAVVYLREYATERITKLRHDLSNMEALLLAPAPEPAPETRTHPVEPPPAEASDPGPIKVGAWDFDENGVWQRHYLHEERRSAAVVDKDGSWKAFRSDGALLASGGPYVAPASRLAEIARWRADGLLLTIPGISLEGGWAEHTTDATLRFVDVALRFVYEQVLFAPGEQIHGAALARALKAWNREKGTNVWPRDVVGALCTIGAIAINAGEDVAGVRLRADR